MWERLVLDAWLPYQQGSAVQKMSVGGFFSICGETASSKGTAEKCLQICIEVLLFILQTNKMSSTFY